MTLVRDFVKDNFMFFVLGVILFGLILLGSWGNDRMYSNEMIKDTAPSSLQ